MEELKYPTTSKTLLDRIAAGDEISWDEFYSRYCGIVRGLAQFKGLDAGEAEDICQQVMLKFFNKSKTFKFDPNVARFRTYFGNIINMTIIDHLRKKSRNLEDPTDEIEAKPVDAESEKLFLNEWRKMIIKEAERELKNRVAPETFQAYELYAVQKRPVEKVAAYLNCSVNQVYQARKRCFAMMQEILLKMKEQDPELQLELSHYGI
ncbi:MAG: sigma-70 family RNA polymerase sigma factor [Lentisphaeria bacterium]|nr:sigma-70 family RNA polymerase sigma factor [Lentisphaeria bacterium]